MWVQEVGDNLFRLLICLDPIGFRYLCVWGGGQEGGEGESHSHYKNAHVTHMWEREERKNERIMHTLCTRTHSYTQIHDAHKLATHHTHIYTHTHMYTHLHIHTHLHALMHT